MKVTMFNDSHPIPIPPTEQGTELEPTTMQEVAVHLEKAMAEQKDEQQQSLKTRINRAIDAAARAGRNDEEALLAWIYQHIMGAQHVIDGAGPLTLSPDAQNLVDEVKRLL